MALNSIAAMRAYGAAMGAPGVQRNSQGASGEENPETKTEKSFADTIADSIKNVNELQKEKASATEAFVAGEIPASMT